MPAGFISKSSGTDLDQVFVLRTQPTDPKAIPVQFVAVDNGLNLSERYMPRLAGMPPGPPTGFLIPDGRDLCELYYPIGGQRDWVIPTWANWGLQVRTAAPEQVTTNSPPLAIFYAGASGLTVTLTNASTDPDGNITHYVVMNWGDGTSSGNIAPNVNASHTFPSNYLGSTVTIQVRVYDAGGLYDSRNLAVLLGNYGGGGGGGCVCLDMYAVGEVLIEDIEVGDMLEIATYDPIGVAHEEVKKTKVTLQPCWRIESESGAAVQASDSTPMQLRDGTVVKLPQMLNREVLVNQSGDIRWEKVVRCDFVGHRLVSHIFVSDNCYFAGEEPDHRIATHNENSTIKV